MEIWDSRLGILDVIRVSLLRVAFGKVLWIGHVLAHSL